MLYKFSPILQDEDRGWCARHINAKRSKARLGDEMVPSIAN